MPPDLYDLLDRFALWAADAEPDEDERAALLAEYDAHKEAARYRPRHLLGDEVVL